MSNYDNDMNVYQSCVHVEYGSLIVFTHIGNEKKCLSPCYYASMLKLGVELTDEPFEAIENLISYHKNVVEENRRVYLTDNKERKYTWQCVHCPLYIVKDWSKINAKIGFVNLSMAPAPCQSDCIYCNHKKTDYTITDDSKNAYERLFQILKYIKEKNIATEDTEWHLSSGEISIHPYKRNLFELLCDVNVTFFSNCFIFSEELAELLKSNRQAKINVSIDSGTALTWKKVKGSNNFNVVLNNLNKYYQYCDQVNYQQIELKYIVLPGINTRTQDYEHVIELMKKLSIKELFISRNFNEQYEPSSPERMDLINHIIELATMCKNNGLSFLLVDGLFTEDEIKYVDTVIKQKNENYR